MRYEPKRWQAEAKVRKDVAELKLDAPGPPKQTFDKSPVILKDDTREVRFYFFGWAHTRGDGFVYLPKEKVLCSGDAAVNGPFNYTADANIANWPKVIAAAQKARCDARSSRSRWTRRQRNSRRTGTLHDRAAQRRASRRQTGKEAG